MVRKELSGAVLRFESRSLKWTTKVVCGNCNNTWMSDLTGKMKAIAEKMILSAHITALTPGDLTVIAQYAFMKSIVADRSHENSESFFDFSQRHSFRENLLIPRGVQMWLAALPFQHALFKSMRIEAPLNTPRRFEMDVFTYGVGHLVIQVAASRWAKKSMRRHADPPVLTQGSDWDTCSIPFWPRVTGISWPPLQFMGRELIDTFVSRWIRMERGW
jgi:hypothetical protein